jgi:hypothetical protein
MDTDPAAVRTALSRSCRSRSPGSRFPASRSSRGCRFPPADERGVRRCPRGVADGASGSWAERAVSPRQKRLPREVIPSRPPLNYRLLTTGELQEGAGKPRRYWAGGEEAEAFQRKSGSVSAQNQPQSGSVSAWITCPADRLIRRGGTVPMGEGELAGSPPLGSRSPSASGGGAGGRDMGFAGAEDQAVPGHLEAGLRVKDVHLAQLL